jgi:predicted nucleic acid-binding protein
MRVLVDTCVWSLAFRRGGPAHPAAERLAALLAGDDEVVLTGTILQEVLQAFRDATVARRVAPHLEDLPLLPLRRELFVEAAALHRACAARGLGATTVDCQIAAAAIAYRCQLLTTDRDFERIAELSALRLAPIV